MEGRLPIQKNDLTRFDKGLELAGYDAYNGKPTLTKNGD